MWAIYIKCPFKTKYLPNVTTFYDRFKQKGDGERQERETVMKEKEQREEIKAIWDVVSDQSHG